MTLRAQGEAMFARSYVDRARRTALNPLDKFSGGAPELRKMYTRSRATDLYSTRLIIRLDVHRTFIRACKIISHRTVLALISLSFGGSDEKRNPASSPTPPARIPSA